MQLILVRWEDSRTSCGQWEILSETPTQSLPVRVVSVGWLLDDAPAHITIAAHYGDEPKQVLGRMTIPKSAIRGKVEYLRHEQSTDAPPEGEQP